MGRIVVGMDGSPSSRDALVWAVDEAERRGDVVEVVLAWDNPYKDMWVPSSRPGVDEMAHFRLALERMVADVLGAQPRVKVETAVAEGHAARVLVDRARGADLLVVGSRGHGGLAGAFLGSVSFNCAAHSSCPVVVVRGREPVAT